jgi:hypothetical protein
MLDINSAAPWYDVAAAVADEWAGGEHTAEVAYVEME